MDLRAKIPDFDLGFELSNMTLNELRLLVARGEGEVLEFKRKVSTPAKIARELCAFANTKGGILLFGVDDDGTIVGVNDHYEQAYEIEEAANRCCKPAVKYKTAIVPWQHSEVMILYVEAAEKKPVYVYQKNKRTVYVRKNDESVVATEQMVEILKHQSSEEGVTFEFGENEQFLFRYLREHGRVTVSDFARLIHQTSYRASAILVKLVSAGILQHYSANQVEYFTFADQ